MTERRSPRERPGNRRSAFGRASLRRLHERLSPLLRPVQLALSLTLLALSVLLAADLFGLGPDPREALRRSRATVAEALAVQLSMLAGESDTEDLNRALSSFVLRNPDVLAAELVRAGGVVLARHGDAAALDEVVSASTATHLNVPILADDLPWGDARVVFAPIDHLARRLAWFAFVVLAFFGSFAAFLGRVLVQLDPGRAVPERVNSAFDLFSAGVVVLDERLRIVMSNRAGTEIAGRAGRSLLGQRMEDWPWRREEGWQAPWATTLQSGLAVSDQPLWLDGADGVARVFSVSCASVGGDEQEPRGVLVTLDDLTPIEQRNRDLSKALMEVRHSREAIAVKNRELERLAKTDPMTGLANRRALVERLEHEFERARREGTPLTCIMTDIDHFKRVNDTYGHAAGDEVIRAVAGVLSSACRRYDTAGRYGGEEFVLVLPGLGAREAAEIAERVRVAVIALGNGGQGRVSRLSSSFGVAELTDDVDDGFELVELADAALYRAKEEGRNRVVVHDPDAPVAEAASPPLEETSPSEGDLVRVRLFELERELERSRRDLEALREFDSLTGIPMRTVFLQRVETEMVRAARSGTLVGVMSFELRGLARIVATLGHKASDTLMVAFVERLQRGLRTSDLVTEIAGEHSMSRITSNEYGVLLCDLADSGGAMIIVTRLKRLLSQPFAIGEERVYVGANIGIALSGSGADNAGELFGQASEARVEASSKPDKVSHGFASAVLDDESHDYIRLEADLRDALEADALETWFQPKFDLLERRVTGMEALLRWRHDTRGFVPPDVFVAVAEANGLIGQLSSFVLERTLRQILVWNAMGFDDLRVSINVSPMQLRAESLVGDTLEALARAGVPGRQLEIELTETSVFDRPEQARLALEQLRSAGVGISMDDFGTGYTSLALLADLPLDTVKVDRSFVAAMCGNERSRAVVESIITMGHALKLRVVGEGVETDEELEMLSRFGCDEVQGYLISRPQPAEDITEFLVRQRAAERVKRAS